MVKKNYPNTFHLTVIVQGRMVVNKQHSEMYVTVEWPATCTNGLVVLSLPLHKFYGFNACIMHGVSKRAL
jgi:hypothetical protein